MRLLLLPRLLFLLLLLKPAWGEEAFPSCIATDPEKGFQYDISLLRNSK